MHERLLSQFTDRQHAESDGMLLDHFVRQHDPAAFEALVRRHGRMVLGVCRRVLGNVNDAEDAFQATFLVLIRKAATIRPRSKVGNWLYGVAFRTALEAKKAMAKRRAKEAKAVPQANESPDNDLREMLDQELTRLPDRYREVIVLCDLEDKSRKEVAQQLGCPEGTVASRLTRARALLAQRLTRRGWSLSTTALAGLLSQEAASVCVPSSALMPLVKMVTGQGIISAEVAALTQGVLKTMFLTKLKMTAFVLLFIGVTGMGIGRAYLYPAVAAQPDAKPSADQPLHREMVLLRQELQRVMDRAAALEAKLAVVEQRSKGSLYRGKPASFWIEQLKDRDPDYRVSAIQALYGLAEVDKSLIPILVESLRDRAQAVRQHTDGGLSQLGGDAVPCLLKALKDPDKQYRLWVLTALADVGPPASEAVPILIEFLKRPELSDRYGAAVALQGIGPAGKAAVPALVELMKDHTSVTCYPAVQAIEAMGPAAKDAVPALIDLLNEKRTEIEFPAEEVRRLQYPAAVVRFNPTEAAALALIAIGPDAEKAIPALREILRQKPVSGATAAKAKEFIDRNAAKP